MVSYATAAIVALMAGSAVAMDIGSASVINACSYPVYLLNVPAAYGGGDPVNITLGHNGTGMPNTFENTTYTQQYTTLSNGDGWSIKLYKDPYQSLSSNIMQYEYTFHDDDTIWFDISDVNGNPWNADWEINTDLWNCTLKQQAYRFSTDDAYGMQSCSQSANITVTLCSGESSDDAGAASASSVAASETAAASSAAASSWASSAEASPTQYSAPAAPWSSSSAEDSPVEPSTTAAAETTTSAAPTSAAPATTVEATTLSTVTYPPHHGWNGHRGGITVTEVATAVVTEVVTSTFWNHPSKRHNHRRHAADRS